MSATTGKRSRLRRPAIILGVVGLLVVGVMGALYRRYTDSARVREHAETYLQRFFGSRVTVKDASFSLFDGVRLHGVAIADPFIESFPAPTDATAAVNSAGTVFYCDEIQIEHDPIAALGGKLVIRSLLAIDPICTIVHDAGSRKTNLAAMFAKGAERTSSTIVLPTVELRDARVRVLSLRQGQMRAVENLRLTVRGRPANKNTRLYDVVWQSGDTPGTSGISQVDLSSGLIRNVRGGLPPMSVEAVMLAINAGYDGASAWRDLLGLGGKVRARDYNLIGNGESKEGRSATIDLNDATVSIPSRKEEIKIPPDQRYLRFTNVNGTIHVTAEQVRAQFTGDFHGADCEVSATISSSVEEWSSLDDVAFDADVAVTNLTLPSRSDDAPAGEQSFVHGWQQLEWLYDKFLPAGPVDFSISAHKRAGAGELVAIKHAKIVAKRASMTYYRYPYRGDNVSGSIEFDADGVWTRDLCATRDDGGTVCVDGWRASTAPEAPARFTIQGTNVAIDDSLFAALRERFQKIRDDFSPSGRIDFAVTTSKEAGPLDDHNRWQTETLVTLRNATATYRHFPYALDQINGSLRIASGRIEFADVVGHSRKATVTVNGSVAFDRNAPDSLALQIVGEDILLDEKLLDALSVKRRENVRLLHAKGAIDVFSTIVRDSKGRVWPTSKITFKNASARPDFFAIPMTEIAGDATIDPDSITFEGISAKYKTGELSLTGTIATENDTTSVDLTLRAAGLTLDESFRDNAPKPLRDVLTEWRVTGAIDASAHLLTGDDGGTSFDATASLTNASVENDLFPIPFTRVFGDVRFTNNGSSSTDLRARYADADVAIEFATSKGENDETGHIKLRAAGLSLSHAFRDVLSPGLRASWDTMKPSGTIDLRLDSLTYAAHAGGPRRWRVEGDASMHGVAIPGILEMKNLEGRVSFSGDPIDARGGTLLSGKIELSRGEVLEKFVTAVNARWQYARAQDGYGRLAFSPIDAVVYDGRLTGNAEVVFDKKKATYDISTLIHSMRLAPFLGATSAGGRSSQGKSNAQGVDGRANIQLRLSGTLGRPTSRRGRGSFEIVNGRIYQLPLVLAVLNSLQLSPPAEGAFDEAQARFFLAGNTVTFDEIVLRGSVVALVGHGTMSLPAYSMDLDLVNIAPDAWGRVPVLTDMLEGATRHLMSIRVTGPISGPGVQVRPLPNLTDEVKDLFRRRRSRRAETRNP